MSIIVPAHNEEALIAATLKAIDEAARGVGVPFEVIVVDDGSTDRTAEIATAHGARVISVALRQIAAARNAGARVAQGDMLVFVDADTIISRGVLSAAAEAMRSGAVGGGSGATFDAATPRWAARAIAAVAWILRTARWAAGCFFFAQRDAFERAGGFDERYFASEEIHLSRALKRLGRFVILRETVITSGRKAGAYPPSRALWLGLRLLWPGSLKSRDRLAFWYRRAEGLAPEDVPAQHLGGGLGTDVRTHRRTK